MWSAHADSGQGRPVCLAEDGELPFPHTRLCLVTQAKEAEAATAAVLQRLSPVYVRAADSRRRLHPGVEAPCCASGTCGCCASCVSAAAAARAGEAMASMARRPPVSAYASAPSAGGKPADDRSNGARAVGSGAGRAGGGARMPPSAFAAEDPRDSAEQPDQDAAASRHSRRMPPSAFAAAVDAGSGGDAQAVASRSETRPPGHAPRNSTEGSPPAQKRPCMPVVWSAFAQDPPEE